jgi:hypothetical protein
MIPDVFDQVNAVFIVTMLSHEVKKLEQIQKIKDNLNDGAQHFRKPSIQSIGQFCSSCFKTFNVYSVILAQ